MLRLRRPGWHGPSLCGVSAGAARPAHVRLPLALRRCWWCRKDAAEAAVEPAEQLRVAELPRQQQIYQDEAWLQSLADRSPDELAEVMDEEVE